MPEYNKLTAFKHDRKLEVRMMKLSKKQAITKSQLLRALVNEAYAKR